jgi:release factor glutamine methyltransferase
VVPSPRPGPAFDLATVIDRLAAAGCVAPEEEAGELVRAGPDRATLERWIERRERGEPLAWIVGAAPFCGRTLLVDPGVYVPRRQSEALARRAAGLLPAGGRAADLCTGAGAIAAHISGEVPSATVVGTDVDARAVACARRNGVAAVVAELGSPLRPDAFDVVTAVAPYVPTDELHLLAADVRRYEPARALDGGIDGLGIVRRAIRSARRLLRAGGWLLVEVGGRQDEELRDALDTAGFTGATSWFDDDGDLRGIAAQAAAVDRGASGTTRCPPQMVE